MEIQTPFDVYRYNGLSELVYPHNVICIPSKYSSKLFGSNQDEFFHDAEKKQFFKGFLKWDDFIQKVKGKNFKEPFIKYVKGYVG